MTVEQVAVVGEGAYERGYAAGEAIGHTKGYEDGYTNGVTDGKEQGYNAGFETGKTEGYTVGRAVGHAEGYAEGATDGYDKGHTDGVATGIEQGKRESYEMITITASKANAKDVTDLFLIMMNDGENRVIFSLMQNDASIMPNNQCISFECQLLNNNANIQPYVWTRYRDGNLQSQRITSTEYDLVITAGDVFKKVVLL